MKPARLFFVLKIWFFLPETRFFSFKSKLLRWAGAKIGENVRICSSVKIYGNGKLEIGKNTWIGHHNMIVTSKPSGVFIGNNIDLAPNIYIGTGTHKIDPLGPNSAGEGISKNVFLKDGCWIGTGTSILPGSSVGLKSVVGAKSLVNGIIPDRTIALGIPAKPKKTI